ncbi:ribonuclease D [Dokdonella sp.]|uniref:ribonuclease D n=1 Tax=Dokdonella sp. TaxID=2291710 RepID=UPI0025C28DDF|nr:ribonuclease D [Dokdonella sp.]
MADWIDRTDSLRNVLASDGDTVGLDTEFMRVDTFAPKLALVQLGIGTTIALIDPLADLDLTPLAARLSDPGTTSIMHSAGEDLDALAPIVPAGLGRLFDTQIAAAFCGLGAGLGYQKLVFSLTGIEVDKGETRSDWLRRPLSPTQLEYAAQDVAHLPFLHARLAERLAERGYAAWHAEDCQRLLDRARRREIDPEPQLAYRMAADWPREQQARLRRTLLWREHTARALDTPRPWLLDEQRLIDFAQRPPLDPGDLYERGRGLRALRKAERAGLFDALAAPIEDADLEFATIPPAASPRERKAISALKDIVIARAAELDLPDGLLCARRHLEALWLTRQWPAALDGWRREILHDALMARLADV